MSFCSTRAGRGCSQTRSVARPLPASAAAPASTSARSTHAPAATPTVRSIRGRSAPILTPQLRGIEHASSLPYASSLCGACYEVCPVKIDIPSVLLHLRQAAVDTVGDRGERVVMNALGWVFAGRRRFELAQRLGRIGQRPLVRGGTIRWLPGKLGGWTRTRDLRPVARQSFREWWAQRP